MLCEFIDLLSLANKEMYFLFKNMYYTNKLMEYLLHLHQGLHQLMHLMPVMNKIGQTVQKQPFRGVLMKRCSENMQQIYRRTPMAKSNFKKIALQFNMGVLKICCIFSGHPCLGTPLEDKWPLKHRPLYLLSMVC